jgi:phosphatase NudJ
MEYETFKIIPIVAAVIEDDQERLLLVREAMPECYGRWNQPAGHVDAHESIADALMREIREETGYRNVRIDGLLRIYYFVDEGLLRMNFRVSIVDDEKGPLADDVLEARWFTRAEIEELMVQGQLRNRRTELVLKDWIAGTTGADAEIIQTIQGI